MPDEKKDWKLSEGALRAGLAAADTVGAERVSRSHLLGLGRIVDANGIELGKFKSDAETGFVLCQIHGISKAVGRDGVWRQTGTCEWCWKQGHSPEAIARRKAEVGDRFEREREAAVRAQLEEEARQIEAHRAEVDAAGEDGQPAPVERPVDARPVPTVRIPSPAPPMAEPDRVEPSAAPRGPAPRHADIIGDSPLEWDDFLCLGSDLPVRDAAPAGDGPADPPPPPAAPRGWTWGRKPRRSHGTQG